MNKEEIINNLNMCISCMEVTENVFVTNKLKAIRTALLDEYSASDMYYEQIREAIREEESFKNLEL